MTVEEYIQQELNSGVKYEYHDGTIYAHAGGTLNHGKLCGNIYAELRTKLKEKKSNCSPYTGEVKLFIEKKNAYVYPDAMVICDEINVASEDKNSVTNPILIVEVLSKSTSDYDRGEKFAIYRQIPSLQEYVLIEQDKSVVEVYHKKPGTDLWSISRYESINDQITFQSIDIVITMSDLYFDIPDIHV